MKKRMIAWFIIPVLVFCCFVTPANASQRSSAQLASYGSDVRALSDGVLSIYFTVNGTGVMDKIGALRIDIFAQEGNLWMPVASYNTESDGMIKTDAAHISSTVRYSGTAGTYYRVVVTIFAENAEGSDSRTEIHYVTARS